MRCVCDVRTGVWMALGAAMALVPGTLLAAPTQPGELVNPLVEPDTCQFCHSYENPLLQEDLPAYAPVDSFLGTLMANSARDPVFWAGVAVAAQDDPGGTEVCIRCHAPRAFLDGNGDATSIDELTLEEQTGVECEVCHRAMDDGVTAAGNAQYVIDDVLVGTNVPRRGPWDFTDGVPEAPHTWIADPFIASSRLCGTCHDVTTERERVDDDGVGLGVSFNEQRTYSEWVNSDFAVAGPTERTCQDCHHPPVEDMAGCIQHANLYSHAEGGGRHDLVGANRFVIELLKSEYGSRGANFLADFYFDNALAALDAFLPTSATLEVEGPSEVDLTQGLSGLDVRVTNNTGHKLPTGYSEGRVMWIEVTASYAGEVVYTSGAWDQNTGQIEQDDQLRTYEAIGEDDADGTNFHLLRNNHWVVDSRIPPMGLRPDLQTDPVGDRYVLLGDNTWPNYDEHSYTFAAAPEIADLTPKDIDDNVLEVTVRLLYVINTAEYIDFLAEAGGDAGTEVATLFDLAGGAPPLVLGEQTLEIPITAFGSELGTSTGPASSTGVPGATTTTGPLGTGPGNSGTAGSTSSGPGAGGGDGGCGCQSGDDNPLGLLLLPLVAFGLRRRRR